MGFLGRIIFLVGTVVAIGIALWLSLALFGIFLVVGGFAVIGLAVRQLLIEKGILNPRPGVPMDEPGPEITVIETEYKEIDEK
jgi:hypothetical protein